jgi:hypothetical protein
MPKKSPKSSAKSSAKKAPSKASKKSQSAAKKTSAQSTGKVVSKKTKESAKKSTSTTKKTSSAEVKKTAVQTQSRPWWLILTTVVLGILAIVAIGFSFLVYGLSPSYIREPEAVHYHFRMQYIVEGKEVDFGQDAFQEEYNRGACSAALTETPIHFHDNKSQLVHIHWQGITGGDVLKYYGLNLVGGLDDTMGYQFIEGELLPKRIAIRGDLLDNLKLDQDLFIYAVNDDGYQKVDTVEFLEQDLEVFFKEYGYEDSHKMHNISSAPSSVAGVRTAQAHAGHDDHNEMKKNADTKAILKIDEAEDVIDDVVTEVGRGAPDSTVPTRGEVPSLPVPGAGLTQTDGGFDTQLTDQELREINHLLGDLIIFVQTQEPSQDEIVERLDQFVELGDSVCGG